MLHGDILGERARVSPDRPALVDASTGARLTYAELDERASRCARALLGELGLRPGDRLALLAHNRLEYIDLFFAAARTGVVLVTLGYRLTPAELEYMLEDSAPRALIYDGALASTVRELRQQVQLERWIALDEPAAPADLRHHEVVARADGGVTWDRPGPEDTLCMIYTSGTTGRPKGVLLPGRMFAWNAYNTVINWQLREDDVTAVFTPLYHAAGMSAFLAPIFAIGGTVVLHRDFDPAEVLRTIERERCTVVLGVPTIFKMLLDCPELGRVSLDHVRWLISGGAPLPTYLVQAYAERGVVLKQGFGMTEVGVNCFTMSAEEARSRSGSIGKPMMFTEARLLDEGGRDVQIGEVGELLLRGPHVSNGYWQNPEATAAALDEEGWLHTGDLARRDGDGFFYIAGRRKEMFISGGVNVYPAEIEAALLQHPAVQDAAVVGVPHPKWGEVGHAFVVLRPGAAASDDELSRHLLGRLARFKVPRRIQRIDTLPRTAYGKVQKHLLLEQIGSGDNTGGDHENQDP